MWKPYWQLPRAVYVLCLGTFVNRAGTLLFPFLTLYLVEQMHTTQRFATRAMAAYGVGAMCAGLIGGHLADRFGRWSIMLISAFGSAALMVMLSFVPDRWTMVVCLLVFAFIAEMYRPACSAMIADVTPSHLRKAAYSLQYVSINLGFSVAPIIGGMIVQRASYRWLFWGDALTTAGLGLILLVGLRETIQLAHAEHAASGAEADGRSGIGRMLRDGTFLVFCAATLSIAMIYMQSVSTLPLYLQSLNINKESYGRIIAVNGIMIAVLQLPFAAWIMRFERSVMIMLSALITGVGFGLTALAALPWHFVLTVIVWTIGEMIGAVLVQPIVSDLAPPRLRARYMGMLSLCFAGGNVFGIPLGGEVLERFGGRALWACCLGTSLVAALLYLSISRRIREPAPRVSPGAADAIVDGSAPV